MNELQYNLKYFFILLFQFQKTKNIINYFAFIIHTDIHS